jgi:outer membrane protein assembly factor BamA
LPDTSTLYDDYINWGIIKPKEAKGGFFTSAKAGLVYDSRDNEPNPMKGIWTEVVLYQSFNKDFTFTKLAITHRQYFTLVKNRLSFAYRLGYQGVIAGEAPFYMLPYMVYSYLPSSTSDGLGGSKSVRGIIRNRVVGEGMFYGNLELRWQFAKFRWINQNFYLALSPFMDMGQVLVDREIDKSEIPTTVDQSMYFNSGKDQLHIAYGGGFRIAMNQNFIIAADMGFPANKQDGNKGLYIGLNWLF